MLPIASPTSWSHSKLGFNLSLNEPSSVGYDALQLELTGQPSVDVQEQFVYLTSSCQSRCLTRLVVIFDAIATHFAGHDTADIHCTPTTISALSHNLQAGVSSLFLCAFLEKLFLVPRLQLHCLPITTKLSLLPPLGPPSHSTFAAF